MTTQQQNRPVTPRPAPRPGRPAAADAIWSWKKSERNPGGSARRVAAHARREGVIRAVVGALIGTLIFLFWHRTVAWVVWGIASVTFLAALASPTGAYRWIQTAVSHLAQWIGSFLSWLLLPVFFYVFCLPFGLLARRGRKDRLERWFDSSLPSYWKRRNDPERTASFYERQF